MKLSQFFLTIDDGPSIHMYKKVDFLKTHKLPAIFYVRGEFLEKNLEAAVYAIQHGFLIGNHSYSHPYFSTIRLADCFEEILKTEKLIDRCYAQAKVERPVRIMRFPFGDRGGKYEAALQEFLKTHNFTRVNFDQFFVSRNIGDLFAEKVRDRVGDLSSSFAKKSDLLSNSISVNNAAGTYIDALWDWDTFDYKSKYIQNPELYTQQLESFFNTYTRDTAVILLHDFENNHHLFDIAMDFLRSKKLF